MGSSQSNTILTSELAATGIILLAGAYFFTSKPQSSTNVGRTDLGAGKQRPKNKRKRENSNKRAKGNADARADVASSIDPLVDERARNDGPAGSSKPSTSKTGVEVTETSSPAVEPQSSSPPAATKKGKRKGKGTAPNSSTPTPNASAVLSSAEQQQTSSSPGGTTESSSVADDDGWTKVSRGSDVEPGASTSSEPLVTKEKAEETRQTLAERLLPKPVPTEVDDMLDKPADLARVMRVVESLSHASSYVGELGPSPDLDASVQIDDEDGWSSVPIRSRKKNTTSTGSATDSGTSTPIGSRPPQELTKKQRQNQSRREAEKAAKVEAEKERLVKLAKHKKDLENERIKAQYSKGKLSGGMKATVDEKGHLIWE